LLTIVRLLDEHRFLERVCAALGSYGDEQRRVARPDDRRELQRFVEFLRCFSDARHHRKEQDVLFPALVAAGLPPGLDGAALLVEHDRVRNHASILQDFAMRSRPWSMPDRRRLAQSTRAYVELMGHHIEDEEARLYRLAEDRLKAGARSAVDAECGRLDGQGGPAATRRLRVLGEDLVLRHQRIADA
jgi:hemerythrin-like domain-containing protein